MLQCIPRIFQSYIDIAQKHRNILFTQGSSRGTVSPAEQARTAGMKFFASCMQVVRSLPTSGDTWQTSAALLEIVDSHSLLGPGDEAAGETLRVLAELACEVLESQLTGHNHFVFQLQISSYATFILDSHALDAGFALSAFATIIHIDYDLAAPLLPRVLRAAATVSSVHSLCIARINRTFDRNHYRLTFRAHCWTTSSSTTPKPAQRTASWTSF